MHLIASSGVRSCVSQKVLVVQVLIFVETTKELQDSDVRKRPIVMNLLWFFFVSSNTHEPLERDFTVISTRDHRYFDVKCSGLFSLMRDAFDAFSKNKTKHIRLSRVTN